MPTAEVYASAFKGYKGINGDKRGEKGQYPQPLQSYSS